MIRSCLDYIPISNTAFIGSVIDCFSPCRPESNIKYNNREVILGYSCRSLFDTIMNYYTTKNKQLRILTTPIHHTSFRNIIEKYVKPENIYILEMNDSFNEIISIPKQNQIDLCIISHLFGQDLKMNIIEDYKKKNPNCVIIEDRVQGGHYYKQFSNNSIDISLYSTGMDKKPCALGGGFVNIRNNFHEKFLLKNFILNQIKNYPQQYFYHRIINLFKKIPTLLLYNSKVIIGGVLSFLNLFGLDINSFAIKYRKTNPGFQHNHFNKNPSNGTLVSMHKSFNRVYEIEKQYFEVTNKFFNALNFNTRKKYFPWVRENFLLTPYNTIYIEDKDLFIKFFKKLKIPILENPTWKMFNFKYKNYDKYEKFNNSLIYIPSLPIMTDKEINYLANILNNY